MKQEPEIGMRVSIRHSDQDETWTEDWVVKNVVAQWSGTYVELERSDEPRATTNMQPYEWHSERVYPTPGSPTANRARLSQIDEEIVTLRERIYKLSQERDELQDVR